MNYSSISVTWLQTLFGVINQDELGQVVIHMVSHHTFQ